MLTYAALIPGHIVSQLIAALVQSELGEAADVICHPEDESGPAKPNAPGQSKKHCPYCAGAAAFQLATFGAPSLLPPPLNIGGAVLATEDESTLRKTVLNPQSRGPPSLPA
jgi:hypothetical protein